MENILNKKKYIAISLAIVIFLISYIALSRLEISGNLPKTLENLASLTKTNNYYISVDDSVKPKSIIVGSGKKILRKITLEDIPSFDTNDEGKASIPEKDYEIDAYAKLDNKNAVVFFSVYNLSTAGNANANRALFSYNIKSGKIKLLKKEDYSISFGALEPSSDGRYLVYSDGYHGGACNNTLGLGVYDLKNDKELELIFLSENKVGSINFYSWIDNSSFHYEIEEYPNEACFDSSVSPSISYKIYKIKENN
jgi:hypothetical protein